MANSTSVTQQFIDVTEDGTKIYSVSAVSTGDATDTDIPVAVTRLTKIKGTPRFSIISDNQSSPAYIVSESVSGQTVTITLNAAIENTKKVTVSGLVFGN